MTIHNETRHTAEFVVSESNGFRSREVGNVVIGGAATDADTPAGTVLGRITVGGNLVPVAPAAADGSQVAAAILYEAAPAAATTKRTIFVRDGEVSATSLNYGGATAPQIAAINTQLAALGIIVR